MEGDWILNLGVWSRIEKWLRPSQIQCETIIPETVRLRKLNDQLFEVCKAAETPRPSLEIVFFHGLQLEVSSQPYLTTWLSRDKSELWLNWLRDDVRILVVSYDASARRTETEGRMDMHIICENLLHNLTDERAHVGQDGCPVILVGHCLGGLVLKEVCVKASSVIGLVRRAEAEKLQNFLDSVKGVFFYATPHHGAILPDLDASSSSGFTVGPLFKDLGPLNEHTARRNQNFSWLRNSRDWKAAGVGEAYAVSLEKFRGFVMQVSEASSRYEVDGVGYYTVAADHFEITRPEDKTSGSFTRLSDFINLIQPEGQLQFSGQKLFVPKHIMGMEALMTNFIDKLESTKCRRWGIVGMGGIGKTTCADILYQNISNKFDYASFVYDVKGQMENNDRKRHHQNLQELILKNLISRSGNKVDPEKFGWERLKNKNVMIVLDDVERDFHVQFTQDKTWDDFSEESLIIVTTRNRRLLESAHFEIHDMECLNEGDSKRLFCLKAFEAEEVPKGFEGHVKNIMLKCENLPLALEVVGSSLYRRDEAAWVATSETIAGAQSVNGYRSDEDGLWSVLRRSYDSLPDKEREMFLDIATCFRGYHILDVRTAWKFMEWGSPDLGWQNLLDRCLVKTDAHGRISMHELLRNLGRSIACSDQPHNLSAYTRVWDVKMANQLSRTEGSRTKVLYTFYGLDYRVLHGLRDLRALRFEDDGAFDNISKLPRGDCIFPPQLTYVNMGTGGSVAMNEVCRIRGLRCLILNWGVRKIPPSLGQLVRLQHLEMDGCEIQVIPKEIGNLCELELLSISSCNRLSGISAEIGQLKKLRCFRIDGCQDLKSLPDSITQLRALQDVTIKHCDSLRFPLSLFGDLRALREVDCQVDGLFEVWVTNGGSEYEVRSRSVSAWTGEKLHPIREKGGVPTIVWVTDYGKCTYLYCSLYSIAGSLSEWGRWRTQRLRIIDVTGDIDEVCNAFWHTFSGLQTLEILHCPDASVLHSFGSHLSELRTLYVQDLPLLKTLPDALVELRALEILEVEDLPRLVRLPESIGDLRALKVLKLKDLPRLVLLPESIGDLRALETLKLSGVPSLDRLPKSVGKLRALRDLEIMGYEVAGAILEAASSGHFCKLKSLTLDLPMKPDAGLFSKLFRQRDVALERLRRERLGEFAALEQLEIRGCEGVMIVPKSVGHLRLLKVLKISHCDELQELPDLVGHLPVLERLEIFSCKNLINLKGSEGQVRALNHLLIFKCPQQAGILHSTVHRRPVKRLTIDFSSSELSASEEQLRTLEYLDVLRSPLRSLPQSIGQLCGLKRLTIGSCSYLNELPPSIGQLCGLKRLTIQFCSFLEELPKSIGQLRGLKRLIITHCWSLKRLPHCIGQLCELKRLSIVGCGKLWVLPLSIAQLGALKHVAITGCERLPSLANLLGQLPALEDLESDSKIWASSAERLGQVGSLKRLTVDLSDFGDSYSKTYPHLDERAVPEFPGRLGALEQLILKSKLDLKLDRLKRAHQSRGWWRTCEQPVIEQLPESVGQLHALKYLELNDFEAIAELPATIGELPRLEKIVVRRCQKLEEWRPSVEHLQHVQELELVYENPKRRCEVSFFTTVLRRQDLLAATRKGRSLREAALAMQEEESEFEPPLVTEEEESD